jgi:hypothetical protein
VARGRAGGVEGTWSDPRTGRSATVTVRAPQVVVACGSLESPALLLRSGIGGPAVGNYLRLHPCTATVGFYADDLQAWEGAPQAGLVREFENIEQGHGFLIEGAHYTTALAASALPYTDAASHKQLMSNLRHAAVLIAPLRDRGHGHVGIDRAGMAAPWYSLTDELDLRNARTAIEAQARLHEAAGAQQILAAAVGAPPWRRGDELAALIAGAQRIPAAGRVVSCSRRIRWEPAAWAPTRTRASRTPGATWSLQRRIHYRCSDREKRQREQARRPPLSGIRQGEGDAVVNAAADREAARVRRRWRRAVRCIARLAPCALFAALVASWGALFLAASAGSLALTVGSLVALTTSFGLLVAWVLADDRRARSNALVLPAAGYDWSEFERMFWAYVDSTTDQS